MNNVKVIREQLGMTQTELCKKSGVGGLQLADIEDGHDFSVGVATWEALAAALNTTVDALADTRTIQSAEDERSRRIKAIIRTLRNGSTSDSIVNIAYGLICK